MDILDLFTDEDVRAKIQTRLPTLFYIAELESSRAGKVGMEVGSSRERILIALLIYKFGKENVETEIPITESEVDVKVFGIPISIKTITGKRLNGVKLIWTVDAEQAYKFSQEYYPCCVILLAHINWQNWGSLYLFPQDTQVETMEKLGRRNYIKLPKAGTNPRGVELSPEALDLLTRHPRSLNLPIEWLRTKMVYDPYQRWIEQWGGSRQ